MAFNDCWCISFTLGRLGAASANPIAAATDADGMEPLLHAVPVIANYLLRSLNLHLASLLSSMLPLLLLLVPLEQHYPSVASVQASSSSSITESESVCRRIT